MAGSAVEVRIPRRTKYEENLVIRGLFLSDSLRGESEKTFNEYGGGFSYETTSRLTKNRSILWRVCNNTICLQEDSTDFNLFGNILNITCQGQVFLPKVVIQELADHVVIYLATCQAVYRMQFLHPNKNRHTLYIPSGFDVSLPSIFNNASINETVGLKNNYAKFQTSCTTFDVTISDSDVAYFALASVVGSIVLVKLPPVESEGLPECLELKQSGVMQKLWAGVGSLLRGDSSFGLQVESLFLQKFGNQIYVFTVCKDLKLRLWSCSSLDCILTKDLTGLVPDDLNNQHGLVQSLMMKSSGSVGQVIFSIHINLTYQSQFIVLEAFKDGAQITVLHISSFFSALNCLQDMALTSQYLWALWLTSEGETHLTYAPVEGGKDYEQGWHSVHMRQNEKSDIYIPTYQDPKEVYLRRLFAPLRFSKETIIKAMQVIVKSSDLPQDLVPDDSADVMQVKESLLQIMDLEVQQNVSTVEIEHSQYYQVQLQCWAKFYGFLLQCDQVAQKPLGILALTDSETVNIVRQDFTGMIVSLAWVDHLFLSDLETCHGLENYISNELELDGGYLARDILTIFQCLKTIPEQFPGDVLLGIGYDLDGNEDVKSFLESMASVLISNFSEYEQLVGDPVERSNYLRQLELRLLQLRQPAKAVEVILQALDIQALSLSMLDRSEREGDDSIIGDDDSLELKHSSTHLFSENGVNLLSDLIAETSSARVEICRDLFILLKLMESLSCKISLTLSDTSLIGEQLAGTCYELLRSYHSVLWTCQYSVCEANLDQIDKNMTLLAALDLTELSPMSRTAQKQELESEKSQVSLMTHFIKGVGLRSSLAHVTESNLNRVKPGTYSTVEVIRLIAHSIFYQVWPLNDKCSYLPEYLAMQCQYVALQEYMQLFSGWCTVSRGTKEFLLAQAYLGGQQPEKALRHFVNAAKGISNCEPLLVSLIQDTDKTKQQMLVLYFIKVMRLFEKFECPDMVLSVASYALNICPKGDSNVPMLWSVVFKHHLELAHHKEAYAAITRNPDRVRRHDCLRHFIVTLCERGLFKEICEYPYIGLEEEVVGIIETRARTMDITVNRYYDLLYSYHVFKGDYRRAATAMYEHSCRLCTEMHGLLSLQKQAKCLLAASTALQLVEEKYAWIVRPREEQPTSEIRVPADDVRQSPKRREDGEEVFHSSLSRSKTTRKTVIVEGADLEKEYLLVLARLKLVQHGQDGLAIVGPSIGASEAIGLLSQSGLFDMAFSIAMNFKLDMTPIFENLATKCGYLLALRGDSLEVDLWQWLTLNEPVTTQVLSGKTRVVSAANVVALSLLQAYLEKFSSRKTSYLKPVATRLLYAGCQLPSWLVGKYKKENAAELLRLYLAYDMIREAGKLVMEYIDAVLGVGKEYFGLHTALHATTPPVWLPYTSIDQLLSALRQNFENQEVAEICEAVQSKLEQYLAQVETASLDKLQYAHMASSRVM